MAFDLDPKEGHTNAQKHGVDVAEAQAPCEDPNLLEIPAETEVERRWLAIGRIGAKPRKLDRDFAAGKSVIDTLDLAVARRPKREQERVNVDFDTWMIEQLEKEASRVGETRQSIVKVWLAEPLSERVSNSGIPSGVRAKRCATVFAGMSAPPADTGRE